MPLEVKTRAASRASLWYSYRSILDWRCGVAFWILCSKYTSMDQKTAEHLHTSSRAIDPLGFLVMQKFGMCILYFVNSWAWLNEYTTLYVYTPMVTSCCAVLKKHYIALAGIRKIWFLTMCVSSRVGSHSLTRIFKPDLTVSSGWNIRPPNTSQSDYWNVYGGKRNPPVLIRLEDYGGKKRGRIQVTSRAKWRRERQIIQNDEAWPW